MENYAFILAWSASIWKRIWRCSYLYCEHNKIEINTSIVLKCLKYNLMSPTGIVFEMIPYLEKAFKQGFLMPKEYEKNEYVKRAVRLFGEAYNIARISDIEKKQKEEIRFIHAFSSTVCFDKEEYKKKEIEEILSFPEYINKRIENKCICSFCELVDAWDIEMSLYKTETELHSLLLCCLLRVLDNKT